MDQRKGGPTITPRSRSHWRRVLHEVIFEADTPAGKGFDVILIASILASVAAVMLDSIGSVRSAHGDILYGIEWFFTLLFTVEYLLRLLCVGRPLSYAVSFYGAVDLLAIIPEGEAVVEEEAIETLGVRSATVIRRPRPGRALHLRNLLRHPFRALMLSQYSTATIACLEDDPSSAVPIRNTFTGSESARNEI